VIAVQELPLDVGRIAGTVSGTEVGGVVTFVGNVRAANAGRVVRRLEYHAYPEMAQRELERLAAEARRRFGVLEVAIVHRTGSLEVGDVAVVIAVGAAHRAEAFEAARWLIDTLKRTVPIWKKELFEGGEVWIEGPEEPPPG